jgi:hypothetical protein
VAISVVGVGAWSSGVATGAPNPSYPAVSINAGDLLIYVINIHKAAARTEDIASMTGWRLEVKRSGNTQATATDTGECMIGAFTKIAVGGETGGTPGQITVSGNTSGTSGTSTAARIFVLRRTTGNSWGVQTADGTDNTTGTSWSITYSHNPGITSGDHLVFGNCLPTDTNPTYGSDSFTASGATIGAAANVSDLVVVAGLDSGGRCGERAVTAGTATAAISWTATLSGTTTNASGPAFVLRAREQTSSFAIPNWRQRAVLLRR